MTSFQNIFSNLRLTAVATPNVAARRSSLASARSLESAVDDWFDAQSISGAPVEEGLFTVVEQETESDHRPEESSEDEDDLDQLRAGAISPLLIMAPKRPRTKKELYPLGEWCGRLVKRRQTLPVQITIPPPSILAFLRKNVYSSISF